MNPLTVLFIEKDAARRAAVHNRFEKHGVNLIEAGTPGEALLIAENHEGQIDFVLAETSVIQEHDHRFSRKQRQVRPGIEKVRTMRANTAGVQG